MGRLTLGICLLTLSVLLPAVAADAAPPEHKPAGADHYGFLDLKIPLANLPNCGPTVTVEQFQGLLTQYDEAYHDPSQALRKLDLTSRITEDLFCAAGRSEYRDFLLELNDDEPRDPQAYLELAMVLQNHWQTQYALGLAVMQQQRMQKISNYSWKLSLLISALGLIPKVPQLSSYFYVAQQLFPMLLPGAIIGGDHYIDKHGMFDGRYPPSPADILTLPMQRENRSYNSYELWKDVASATASVAGSQVAYRMLGLVSEAITVGKVSFNPVTIVGSLLIGEEIQTFAGMAVDDYEYHKLLTRLMSDRDAIESAADEGNELQVVAKSNALERDAIALSSFLDTPAVNAWAKYDQAVHTAKYGSTWKTWVGTAIEFYTKLAPEYFFPTRADQKKAITQAGIARDRQIESIQAAEDPVSLKDVQLAFAMNAMQQDPRNASLLPEAEQEQGQLIAQGYPLSGIRSYPRYIGELQSAQIRRLAENFRQGVTYRNPSHVLLETAAFLQSLDDRHLQPVTDNLLNVLNSGQLIQN